MEEAGLATRMDWPPRKKGAVRCWGGGEGEDAPSEGGEGRDGDEVVVLDISGDFVEEEADEVGLLAAGDGLGLGYSEGPFQSFPKPSSLEKAFISSRQRLYSLWAMERSSSGV